KARRSRSRRRPTRRRSRRSTGTTARGSTRSLRSRLVRETCGAAASKPARIVRLAAGVVTALALAAARSSSPKPPAPSIGRGGEKKSLKALDGGGEGTYTTPAYNRTGSIVFEVFSGGEEAHGDILMVPPGSQEPLQPSRPPSPGETLKTMPR